MKSPNLSTRVGLTYTLIICLLGSDPRLDFLTMHAYASCDIPSNPSSESVRVTYFTYDFDNHLTQVNCPEGVINYEYELATGRHTNTCTINSEVAYGYDELGRLKTVSLVKRNGTNIPTETTTYTYTKVGSRDSVTLPNGVVTKYLYDELNRLTNMTHKLGGTNLLASYTYQLHTTGRRTNAVEILKTEDSGTPWITNTLTWSYDQMYRLTNEISISSHSSGTYTNSYQYDKVGNRWAKTHYQNGNTTVITNAFNENDQLLKEVTLVSGTPNATNSYAYDANGSLAGRTNVTSSGTATALYGYNLKNKLSEVTANGSTTTYLYNDQGIRVRSTTGGTSTHYLIDANNHTSYQQILEELWKPKDAIVLLGQEIEYYASKASFENGLLAEWQKAPEWKREVIVGSMTTAKDQDDYYWGTEFGDLGVEAYHDIKNKNMLGR